MAEGNLIERRVGEEAAHAIILSEIKSVGTEIDGLNKRLDKINGSITNFEDNKFKRDLAYDNILTNSIEHKNFMSKVAMTTIGSILGLILTIHTVLDLFKITIGG